MAHRMSSQNIVLKKVLFLVIVEWQRNQILGAVVTVSQEPKPQYPASKVSIDSHCSTKQKARPNLGIVTLKIFCYCIIYDYALWIVVPGLLCF